MVGHEILDLGIMVRVHARQPYCRAKAVRQQRRTAFFIGKQLG